MSLSVLSHDSKTKLSTEDEIKKYANNVGNHGDIEMLWAHKAFRQTKIHFNLICSVNCTKLKLTKFDNELYEQFLLSFPNIKIDVLKEHELKSEVAKRRWRNFCYIFQNHLEDFNFGCLLRLNTYKDYSPDNTTLVPRVQFLAIEVARNRQGLNLCHFGKNPADLVAERESKAV